MAGLGLICPQIKVYPAELLPEGSEEESDYKLIPPADLILFLVTVVLRYLSHCYWVRASLCSDAACTPFHVSSPYSKAAICTKSILCFKSL